METAANPEYYVAICEDLPEDPRGPFYTIYFVNDSDKPIDLLKLESGGFASWDDDIAYTSTTAKCFEAIPPKSSVEIERDDVGDFDFVIVFDAEIRLGKERKRLRFWLNKGCAFDKKTHIPVLGKDGVVIVGRRED